MAKLPKQVALSSSLSNPRMSLSPSMTPSPAISLSSRRKVGAFPVFRSLKIIAPPIRSVPLLNCRTRSVVRRVGRIVSDAQETSVDVTTVTDATWKSLVLEAEGPVLVEFWASWCGPCHMNHPIICELAKEYTGRLKCFKLNTDDCPSTAKQYGIRSIPTTMIFVNGEKKEAIIGAVPKTALTSSIAKFL